MKKFITRLLIAATVTTSLYSCKKLNDVVPNPSKGNNTNTESGSGSGSGSGTASAPVKLDIAIQEVNTKVSNDTLYLNYTEKVNLLLNPDDYQNSSAIHFKEDFSKSSLANFSFTTVNKENQLATNYLDDNLNNVAIKSASTVTIDGKKFTRLVFERLIIFSKAYKQNGLAVEAQTNIMKQTSEVIGFSSYYYINGKNSDTTKTTATILYKK
ncbi:hypothetical protein [Mucilaginibacter celer]|uniref:Uncharacterized protein n=1 Tax=Mucilaginibacter celer TaxID=2305508 RepID=A0A494VP61_9SPHI|nr:hypothetical protein [Mucilaginibacter celer]AYL97227.1 hypothetical protein HYN43_018775 [Mucilaginibacter celer]